LIGCSTFLTAGHCIGDAWRASFVFCRDLSVVSMAQHLELRLPAGDVAVLKLGAAVECRTDAIQSTAPAFGAPPP
jgi:hypothetical protein